MSDASALARHRRRMRRRSPRALPRPTSRWWRCRRRVVPGAAHGGHGEPRDLQDADPPGGGARPLRRALPRLHARLAPEPPATFEVVTAVGFLLLAATLTSELLENIGLPHLTGYLAAGHHRRAAHPASSSPRARGEAPHAGELAGSRAHRACRRCRAEARRCSPRRAARSPGRRSSQNVDRPGRSSPLAFVFAPQPFLPFTRGARALSRSAASRLLWGSRSR